MNIDMRVAEYFKNVKQVFLYLTDECNLLCKQCLYKPNVLLGKSIDFKLAKELLLTFRDFGARKITFLGGEVSLYDNANHGEKLFKLIKHSRDIGYSYIRVDTNGQFLPYFLEKLQHIKIDDLAFSVDGNNSEVNDLLRSPGAFEKSDRNIKRASALKIPFSITSCVTRQGVDMAGSVFAFLHEMICYAMEMKAHSINFHGVFKMGVPMDAWTSGTHIEPREWTEGMQQILHSISLKKYRIDIRLPTHFTTTEIFHENPALYGYCPCKCGERALIHPDGNIRVCSSLLSTSYGVALFNSDSIVWNGYCNELQAHKLKAKTHCTNQKILNSDGLIPVCFSIKPLQREFVWNTFVASMIGENNGKRN